MLAYDRPTTLYPRGGGGNEHPSVPGIAREYTVTETQIGLSSYVRRVAVTIFVCFAGTVAAVVSSVVMGTSPEIAINQSAAGILGVLALIQSLILRVVGIDVSGFGVKDHLYIMPITSVLWFATFATLLTLGVQL